MTCRTGAGRLLFRNISCLVHAGQRVKLSQKPDDWMTGTETGRKRGGNAAEIPGYGKPFFFQKISLQGAGAGLLVTGLCKFPDLVADGCKLLFKILLIHME